jgi:hypothetical protein
MCQVIGSRVLEDGVSQIPNTSGIGLVACTYFSLGSQPLEELLDAQMERKMLRFTILLEELRPSSLSASSYAWCIITKI